MEMEIPAPKNWQTFESLCARLWSSIWGTMAQKVGRTGQEQHGVDVFGVSFYDGGLCAVQCKLKNYNIGSQLTTKEIDNESSNAMNFAQDLKQLTFATTTSRDVKLQQHCLKKNADPNKSFKVDVWSWDDIQAEIQYRKEIMDYFYHDLPTEHTETAIFDTAFSIPRLAAFFSRDNIKRLFCRQDRILLCNLAFELFDNAYKYGRATKFTLKIEDNKIWFVDNGLRFNSRELSGNNGGAITMKKVLDTFKDVTYQYVEKENRLSIMLPETIEDDEDTIELVLDGRDMRNREEIGRQVLSIPNEVQNVIVNVTAMIPLSGTMTFCKHLNNSNKKVTIYLPFCYGYKKNLEEQYPNITFIERK